MSYDEKIVSFSRNVTLEDTLASILDSKKETKITKTIEVRYIIIDVNTS